ncbi:MAG TPA: acyltransferase [Anaerolineales bacterium]|nr:acyltransferase [Anaerolineales bacterium]
MIIGLDGLRALAFLGVFAFHTGGLMSGWVGVNLFFVLSGFLITDILLRMKDSLPGREFFSKFYGRRALRILPLYYFYLLSLTLLFFAIPNVSFGPFVKNFSREFARNIWFAVFYVYDFFFASSGYQTSWVFGHLWSLSVEEQFYLIWPLLIFLVPNKYFKRLCLVSIGLGPSFRLLTTLIYRHHLFPFLLGNPQLATYVLPFSHLDAFGLGAFISRFEIPQPRLQLLGLLIITPAAGLMADQLVTGHYVLASLGYKWPLAGAYKEVWGYSLLNYLFAVLIVCVVRTKLFNSDLNGSVLRYLGKISYGLYVYHLFALAIVVSIFKKRALPYPLSSAEVFWCALILTIVISSLSYHLLERPLLNLKTRFFPIASTAPVSESLASSTRAQAGK